MIRRIIHIDEEKCNGCGACAEACHEGAIAMVDGKAKLTREDYCDGLGDCLPACPADAIHFEEREAPAYDEAAVQAAKARKGLTPSDAAPGRLRNWPVQIRLVPPKAPWFEGADLLVAADCSAYACAGFHQTFIRNRVCVVGCPKLDRVDYAEKLEDILTRNDIASLTVVRMEVPCCGGLEYAARTALKNSGKAIPCQVATLSVDGRILED